MESLNVSLGSELRLLLRCATTQIQDASIQEIEVLAGQNDLDWDYLIETAGNHGVLPLLYQSLSAVAPDVVPQQMLKQLRQFVQQIALKNTLFTRELLSILQLLETHGIRALPFKGPVLAVSAYGNLALRNFCDLDIWVEPHRVLDAIAILTTEAGYCSGRQWHFLDPAQEASFMNSWREYGLRKGIVPIDLHRNLTVEDFLSSALTFDLLWERREMITIAGQSVPSFSQADLLIYLCLHGSKECWRGLKWICDVAEWVQNSPQANWTEILMRSQVLRCERRLLLGLSLAHTFLGTPLPPLIEQKLAQDVIGQQLTHQCVQKLFDSNNRLGRRFTREKFWFHLRSVEHPQDRWDSLKEIRRHMRSKVIKVLPNTLDHEFLPLPRPFYFLYYFLRPVRLLTQTGKKALSLVF
ncbi:nucleotidyltransferase domain-containing protein [Acaryochloris thomasi]|uniref:nucleotidyltransferase domain-containing protein n=1 Tax=Acaryochloris thomasi TaxID=2929456 RepID=UPI001314CFF4|nr:nucleotidyltransferase family protein [Acaryochloris thomasi]